MNIRLCKMTKALCRAYFQEFVQDPALYLDQSKFQPYMYDEAKCDAYFDRYVQLGRVHFAIMLDSEPVGEVVLKNIDYEKLRSRRWEWKQFSRMRSLQISAAGMC